MSALEVILVISAWALLFFVLGWAFYRDCRTGGHR
jgi:hypothetical protein